MTDDFQLLRQYAQGSESAFGELVSRYVNLVYSAALRQTGNVQHAQDVAQTVFAALARKARTLSHDVVLGGWLYRHACFAAAQTMRTERRRQARERRAVTMDELQNRSETDWERLAPVLDDAMRSLGGTDRDAIVLRYFEKRDLQGVGAALGISQEAARKRVTRALEKLRGQLARKGVTSTAAALALTLAGNAITAAPAGFAATLTSASLAGVAAAGTTFSILGFTIMTKLQAGIISALVVAATVTSLLIQHRAQARLREKDQMLEQQAARLAQLAAENERLSNLVANASRPAANDQLNELMRLRGQMGALRRQTNEVGELQEENRRLQQAAKPEPAAAAALHSRKAGFARNFAMALISYASENQNQFPTNFDQISRCLPAAWEHTPVPTSDLDGFIQATNQFEIVFHGSFDTATLTNWRSVVVVRERQAWLTPEGAWAKTYGFADGHSETHTSTDGDFKRWDSTPSDGN